MDQRNLLKNFIYIKMEQKSPGIYILELLTEAGDVDFEWDDMRQHETNTGPCCAQGNWVQFSSVNLGNWTFIHMAPEEKQKDPYVRETATICVAKLYDITPELMEDNGF